MEQLFFFFSFLISRGCKYAHYYLLQAKVQLSGGAFRLNISAVLPESCNFLKGDGGLEYRNKGGDNYNCAYATPVDFHVFMKYVAPTKFTHKSA